MLTGDSTKFDDLPMEGASEGSGVTRLTRRSVLKIVGGGLFAAVGFVAGRLIESSGTPIAHQIAAPPASPLGGVNGMGGSRFALNLRPLKPYDLQAPSVTFTHTQMLQGGVAGPDISITIGTDDPAVSGQDAAVLTIAVPKINSPIRKVTVSTLAGGPAPILETLNDVGIASDVTNVTPPGGNKPAVGDLWCLVPRDRLWMPGRYRVEVEAEGTSFHRRFSVV